MWMKYDDDKYLVKEGWIGLGARFWFKVRKKRRKKFVLEIITDRDLDSFKSEDEAIEYAKHILWCLGEMLEKPK